MIERMLLTNFQCHERLDLELDPHMNVLVGRSDVGKTAALRALRWVIFNRPTGDALLRHGAKNVIVDLQVDGHWANRSKGAAGNTYLLDDARYAAFGAGVPDPITALLNVSEVSVQRQHDGPFLFDRTPGEVSRALNEVVNLDLIDGVLATLAAGLRKAKAERQVVADRLSAAKAEQELLAWVPAAAEAMAQLELEKVQLEKTRQDVRRLRQMLSSVGSSAETLRDASKAILALAKACSEGEQTRVLALRVEKLRKLVNDCIASKRAYSGKRIPPDQLTGLQEMADAMEQLRRRRVGLLEQLRHVREAEASWSSLQSVAATSISALQEASRGLCPTCGRPMKR